MVRKQLLLFIPILFLTIVFLSCKKNDNENKLLTVSRLYISNSDTAKAIANITVFDPADANPFPAPYNYKSLVPDAGGIHFDPFSGTLFQVGRQNKNIKLFNVSLYGILTERSSFVDSSLVGAREISFNRRDSSLYVSSDTLNAIYVYKNPTALSGSSVKPSKIYYLNGQPWGIHLNGDSLLVVMDLDKREIQLYPTASKLDSGKLAVSASTIIINGAIRLHGITYSAKQDLLIVTDIGLEDDPSDGKVYIIEGANAKFLANSAITPTRTISGTNTGLGNPVDVGLDERNGKNLVYVADKINKKILVFHVADTGDVAPAAVQTLTASPEAIYVDAR